MKINNAFFRRGVKGSNDIFLEDKKHIAFYGRSNVGKSSSINKILNRKKLVKSSATPGKTKEINFFEVEMNRVELGEFEKVFFVDLPGYGYAKMSKMDREKLRKLILWYILYSEVKNRLNIILIDARRGVGDFDQQLIEMFIQQDEKFIILVNKIDKLNQKEKNKIEKEILGKFSDIKIIFFSAKTGKGVEKIYDYL